MWGVGWSRRWVRRAGSGGPVRSGIAALSLCRTAELGARPISRKSSFAYLLAPVVSRSCRAALFRRSGGRCGDRFGRDPDTVCDELQRLQRRWAVAKSPFFSHPVAPPISRSDGGEGAGSEPLRHCGELARKVSRAQGSQVCLTKWISTAKFELRSPMWSSD